MSSSRDGHLCCSCASSNRTPTPRTPSTHPDAKSRSFNTDSATWSHDATYAQPSSQQSSSTTATTIFIVTDTCYPTTSSFESNIGTTVVDSVYSSITAANARAKKIIFENGRCRVDIDKIIEEKKDGLYTGIGIGGKEGGGEGSCYARKCQVEGKIVDEDSEAEDESSGEGAEGDVAMG